MSSASTPRSKRLTIARQEAAKVAIKRRIEALYEDPKNVAEDKERARLLAANWSGKGAEW